MRQGCDPEKRDLGSVMDVVEPSTPNLERGQKDLRGTLWRLWDAKWPCL